MGAIHASYIKYKTSFGLSPRKKKSDFGEVQGEAR